MVALWLAAGAAHAQESPPAEQEAARESGVASPEAALPPSDDAGAPAAAPEATAPSADPDAPDTTPPSADPDAPDTTPPSDGPAAPESAPTEDGGTNDSSTPEAAAGITGVMDSVRARIDQQSEADSAAAPAADPNAPPGQEPLLVRQQRVWQEALNKLEGQAGAYDASLSQQLVGLGRAYQDAGKHREAVQVLGRAAHITRVNEGLYSVSSIPILEMMIESYAALGDWNAVGTRYHRIFQDQQKIYGTNDLRLLPPLRKLSSWHVRAYLENLDSANENGPLNHLLVARQLYDAAIGILSANYGPNDERLVDTLRESSLVSFYLARTIPREPQQGFSFSTAAPGAAQREDIFNGGTEIYSFRGYRSGLEALQHIVSIHRANPETSAEVHGRSIAELGDWNLLFGRQQNALALYREAYATVAQSGLPPEQVEQIFAQPVALPAAQFSMFGDPDSRAPGSNILVATFDISDRGRAQRVFIEQTDPPPPQKYASRAKKLVQGMMFRPRLSNGEAVSATGLRYEYSYLP